MLPHFQKSIQCSKNEKSGFNLKAVAQTVWHYCYTTSMAFTIMFKSLGSIQNFFFKEINTNIQQGLINLIKSESKYFYTVTNNLYFQ